MKEEKGGPLSDTRVTGKPCVASTVCNLSIVCDADVELATKTSGHFDNASTITNKESFPTGHDPRVCVPKHSEALTRGEPVILVDLELLVYIGDSS